MRRHALSSLLASTAACVAVLLGVALPAAADWLVMRDGGRVETRGPWKVQGKRIIFTLADGTLSSLQTDDVDLAASEKATQASREAPAPEAPAPAELGKPRTVITDKTVKHPDSTAGPAYEIGLAGENWVVSLELPGYAIQSEKEQPDHLSKSIEAMNESTGMAISVLVEREPGQDSLPKCRDFYWTKMAQSPVQKTGIVFSDAPGMSLVTWTVPDAKGTQAMQHNINAYLNHGDVCVDVHLSKADFHSGSDEQLFEAVLRTVSIRDRQ